MMTLHNPRGHGNRPYSKSSTPPSFLPALPKGGPRRKRPLVLPRGTSTNTWRRLFSTVGTKISRDQQPMKLII
jgi:hypothetical protein